VVATVSDGPPGLTRSHPSVTLVGHLVASGGNLRAG